MDKLVKFLPHAGIIACLAFLCIFFTSLEGNRYLVGWAIFQTWALYFFSGATLKSGLRAMLCYMLGALASVLIFWLAGVLGGSIVALSIVGAVVTFTIICLEIAPYYINYIPAYFIGAGSYFALTTINGPKGIAIPSFQLQVMVITCLAGGAMGWATVFFRTTYGTWRAKLNAARAAAAQPPAAEPAVVDERAQP